MLEGVTSCGATYLKSNGVSSMLDKQVSWIVSRWKSTRTVSLSATSFVPYLAHEGHVHQHYPQGEMCQCVRGGCI